MKAHLTVPTVKNLNPKEKPYEVVDDHLKGFLARVQPTGVITYYLAYRTREGVKRRFRIGRHPGVTAPAARKAAEQLMSEVTLGGDPHNARKSARTKNARSRGETLGGFIDIQYAKWALSHQKRGNETLTLLESNFKDLYARKMNLITAWDIQKWRTDSRKSGLKPTTINRRVTTLKAVLNKAVEWDVIPSNPLQKIKPLKVDNNSRIRYLDNNEERQLRQALNDREHSSRSGRASGNKWRDIRGYDSLPSLDCVFVDHLKPMVLLALNTGLRRGEIFNLKWTDVDFSRKTLTVEGATTKSGQTRHIALNAEIIRVLQEWQQQTVSELVFQSPVTGEPFNNIKTSWSQLRKNANITDFRFHDLRHTFASKLVMADVNLYTVKELMGHSTIQMTERYAHLAPEHKATAVERLVNLNRDQF
jgi:integrase